MDPIAPPRALLLIAAIALGCAPRPAADAADDTEVDTEVDTVDTDLPVDVLPPCPVFDEGVAAGALSDPSLDEISGIVASRAWPSTWWAHNDSGDAAQLYALDDGGVLLGTFPVADAVAADWEDIAIGPDGDGWVIWVGDIGDNFELRLDVVVWRVPEPDPSAPGTILDAEAVRLSYPDGPHNAETLWVDPRTGDLLIVTKEPEGSGVYLAKAPVQTGGTFERVATLPFGSELLPGSDLATGGEIAPDGSALLVRTTDRAWWWRRGSRSTVAEALATTPCPVSSRAEAQGEAIAFSPDSRGYRTVSEGKSSTVWAFSPL